VNTTAIPALARALIHPNSRALVFAACQTLASNSLASRGSISMPLTRCQRASFAVGGLREPN